MRSFEAIKSELIQLDAWSPNDIRMLRYMLLNDGMMFLRYFFKLREGNRLRLNWHMFVINHVLQAIYDCKINRLIINISPGFLKTEQVIIQGIARGLAINPKATFIHTSFSDQLVARNSIMIKETVKSPEYQQLWPMQLKHDRRSQKEWYTEYGGGMRAAPAGGTITGFHAGRVEDGFSGGIFIDDPVKPADALSDIRRRKVNETFNNTMRSRLTVDTNPIVLTAQRIHDDDLSGFLLRGGSGDMWYHLSLPALFDEEYHDSPYNLEYTHGIPIDISKLLKQIHAGEPFSV